MTDLEICWKCNENILSADKMKCDAICGRFVHARCIKITKTVLKAWQEIDNFLYVCDECNSDSFKAINVKLNKILSVICIYDERVARNEKNVSNLVDQIGDLKLLLNAGNNKDGKEVTNTDNKKIKTYAEKVKMKNNESVVLLKPKCTQNSNDTENDLKKAIDPKMVKFQNIRKFPRGGLAIECGNIVESQEVEKIVSEKMGEKYEVSVPNLRKPRVKIIGIENELSVDDLVETIKSQNEWLMNDDIKVINLFKTKIDNYSAIVELEPDAFEKCMKAKRIKIKWTMCRLYEDLNVFRCFKCNGYNHKQVNCTNKLSCKVCAGNHHSSVCRAKTEMCVNCKTANDKFGVKLRTNHAANSDKCSIYVKKLETVRRQIKYSA